MISGKLTTRIYGTERDLKKQACATSASKALIRTNIREKT
jgi:hypothetical protein